MNFKEIHSNTEFILTLLGEHYSLKEKIKYKKDCEIAYPQSNKEFKI